ncbi:MAG: branched-chain amino acid ABC transporter permease [Clostridia bacterium]|nr:branched-chain amino acid ABC transporter permease [Clostridia bacterium]
MFYRQCGIRYTSYAADRPFVPLRFDRYQVGAVLVLAVTAPLWLPPVYLTSYLLPFVIFATATLGLNLLVGRTGQIHIGYSAVMAIGAYAAIHLVRSGVPFELALLGAGVISSLVGLAVGAVALRVKGLYLAVATLALQYLVDWAILHVPAIGGGAQSTLQAPWPQLLGGLLPVKSVAGRYWLALTWCVMVTLFMVSLGHTGLGRALVAIREKDYAASVIGIDVFYYKLLAFWVSSVLGGVTGAILAFCYYRAVTVEQFSLDVSIQLLAMVLVGGIGSVLGSFFGAGMILLVPIVLSNVLGMLSTGLGLRLSVDFLATLQLVVYGGLIVVFLLVEPLGLAKIYDNVRKYFLVWPFGYARRSLA